jgi:tRNA A37 threonylcarbamoyladenosine dehydratase
MAPQAQNERYMSRARFALARELPTRQCVIGIVAAVVAVVGRGGIGSRIRLVRQ